MPGRTSVRASRSARESSAAVATVATKVSTRTRASARQSVQAVQIPEEGEQTALRERICRCFADAQKTLATQRKLIVSLRKIQEICCYEPTKPTKNSFTEEYEENDFNQEFGRCVLRIMAIKKSEAVGDRLVRFLGLFLKHASERDNAIFNSDDGDVTESIPETPTSRLTSHILALLLDGMTTKDKIIRYRSTQIVANIINTLDSIDDEHFQLVRMALLKRLRDKESTVRAQAVMGLGRLADENDNDDDDDSDDDSAGSILQKLREALQHDPSADVRRALLLNLPFTPGTLPFLLERARDFDAATRRALYSRLLPALGDFRHLSLTHREKLLRWGLRDRDDNVRKATARLFRERWIEDCARAGDEEAEPAASQTAAEPSMDALMELLERIDVVNSGIETGIAHEAMREFWDGRPDYVDYITFDDPYFDELSPEAAFIARTFNEYCRKSQSSKIQSIVEDKMPEVTKFAFLLQRHIAKLVEGVEAVATDPDDADAEEDTVQQEFCVEQLLHIALSLDYSDEMGRRKMFSIMRESLALAELPEECTKLTVEVLRNVCGKDIAGEQEFCSIVLEAVAEVHDTILGDDPSQTLDNDDDNESFHSARSEVSDDSTPKKSNKPKKNGAKGEPEIMSEEQAIREIMVNMKCLHIGQCMLQNVQCDLEQNSHLVTMLNNLVVPAVRSQEAPIRERGLICLGLCCLLSKNLAEENLTLFLHCFSKGHEALQVIAIQIITDILTAHPALLTPTPTTEASEIEPNSHIKPVYKMFSKSIRSPEAPVQTQGCTALAKLMLASAIRDSDLLKQMVLAYFDPETRGNPGLRQALTYFLPVYCHSRRENAEALAKIAIPIMHNLSDRAEDLDEEEEMVGLTSVAAQICDWTDPRKYVLGSEDVSRGVNHMDGHIVLSIELLEKILTPGCSKEEKKVFIAMLGKLHIDPKTPVAAIQQLADLVTEAQESKLANEASSRNTLTKLSTALGKILSTAATTTGAEAGREDESAPASPAVTAADQPLESTEADLSAGTVLTRTDKASSPAADDTEDTEDATEFDDRTMITRGFTMPPDAEGTVMGDFLVEEDEDEDEGEGETTVVIRTRPSVAGDDSLLESLLEEDDSETM